jgi:hypothetical protein
MGPPGAGFRTDCADRDLLQWNSATQGWQCVSLKSLYLQQSYVLAQATSIDQNGSERLIARLEDANDDDVVSVGDAIVTREYPTAFDGSAYSQFSTTLHVVTEVVSSLPNLIQVRAGTAPISGVPKDFVWFQNPTSGAKHYSESGDGYTVVELRAGECGPSYVCPELEIRAEIGSPSAPAQAVSLYQLLERTYKPATVDVRATINIRIL